MILVFVALTLRVYKQTFKALNLDILSLHCGNKQNCPVDCKSSGIGARAGLPLTLQNPGGSNVQHQSGKIAGTRLQPMRSAAWDEPSKAMWVGLPELWGHNP